MTSLMELNAVRKNKITLSDYDYQKDIENRLLMSQFTSLDLELLEEILYSSLQIPVKKLAKSLETEEARLVPSLEKLSRTGLFTFSGDTIVVEKEMRKYFEAQIVKFEEDFVPGMEFLQSLLRKVPIHVLPIWYSIPRTSNNIFDSLIEKYLLTPQIFQRYLMELSFTDPVMKGIVEDVYASPHLEVSAKELMEKYHISKEQFEECLLQLEFNFVCCLGYKKNGDCWEEKVTPYQEWKDYLTYLKDSEVSTIENTALIKKKRPNEYSFVKDMSLLLERAKKQPIPVELKENGHVSVQGKQLQSLLSLFSDLSMQADDVEEYLHLILTKAKLLKLAEVVDKKLHILELAHDWLDMRAENQAMFLYRHPLNRILNEDIPPSLCTEKYIREAERSLLRALNKGWVYFDEFLKGVHVPLNEGSAVTLKKIGKSWRYATPSYTDAEVDFIKATIFEWLFEAGLVQVGTHNGRDCFCVTSLGHSLFGR